MNDLNSIVFSTYNYDLIMKTWHNDAFLEIHNFVSASELHVPKALFCSIINAILQIVFEL